MRTGVGPALLLALFAGSVLVLAGCADAPARAPAVARPAEAVTPTAPSAPPIPDTSSPTPAPELAAPASPEPAPAAPEPLEAPVPPGPPPDLAFSMASADPQPPAGVDNALKALVARLKKGNALSMRITLFAPPVASREYALGLAAKVSETLRRHLRGLGVPPRKIIRVVIDPRRTTVTPDERIDVEIRLISDK
jgi:type IV pilus biogenesis protein CpaD/CtpE